MVLPVEVASPSRFWKLLHHHPSHQDPEHCASLGALLTPRPLPGGTLAWPRPRHPSPADLRAHAWACCVIAQGLVTAEAGPAVPRDPQAAPSPPPHAPNTQSTLLLIYSPRCRHHGQQLFTDGPTRAGTRTRVAPDCPSAWRPGDAHEIRGNQQIRFSESPRSVSDNI